jgi:hypothetical protein
MNSYRLVIHDVQFTLEVTDEGFALKDENETAIIDASTITKNAAFFVSRAVDHEAIGMFGKWLHDGIEFEITRKGTSNETNS